MRLRADDVADSAKLVPLAEPRSLTESERDLLGALVAQVGRSEMDEQVASVVVVAECSCGCPSVGLATDGPELSPDIVKALNRGGRDDYLAIGAVATNSDGRDVAVTAHVVDGRLDELEIWAGGDGGEVQTELPRPAAPRPMADGQRADVPDATAPGLLASSRGDQPAPARTRAKRALAAGRGGEAADLSS